MKNSQLDGARAKIARAVHHFNQLNLAIDAIFADESNTAAANPPAYEYKAERQELIIMRPHGTPLDPALPLIIGDCIHNARSSLDYLVFQLAVLNNAPSEAASMTSFPVCLSPAQFKKSTQGKIAPFISGPALTAIQELQPYLTGNAGRDDILWVLSQLDIFDKHRLLIVTKSKVRPVAFTVTVPSGETFTSDIKSGPWKPTEAGTELIRFDLSNAIRHPGEVQVDLATAMTIQIENTGLICDELHVQAVLSDCIQVVDSIINDFGRRFFGE